MRSGRLDVTTEQALCTLLVSVAEHAVQQKARAVGRQRQRELRYCLARDSAGAGRRSLDGSAPGLDLEQILASLEADTDRHILTQLMAGTSFRAIASQLGLREPALRKRWQRLKHELQVRFCPEARAGLASDPLIEMPRNREAPAQGTARSGIDS